MRNAIRLSILAVILSVACTVAVGAAVITLKPVALPVAAIAGTRSATTYATHVRELDRWIDGLMARVQAHPDSYLTYESLANAYRNRAQFTGAYIDFQRATECMEHSFAVAGAGTGPYLSRAQLNASLHRYPLIDADLRAASGGYNDQKKAAAIVALTGSSAFYCGRYDDALEDYRRALELDRSPTNLFALADARASIGDRDGSELLLDEAERLAVDSDVVTRAWLAVQRGVLALDRGRWDEAEQRYRQADSILSGWWMVESRLAELAALRGDSAAAITAYRDLVKRTGKPELMDALSTLLRADGQEADAARWAETARVAYAALLSDHPEAAYGHALDHYLSVDADAAMAVDLAERNHQLRPGGEATTKLARAYLKAGRIEDARATIDGLLATPWNTAQAHATAAAVYAAGGDRTRADAQRALARAIDPHS